MTENAQKRLLLVIRHPPYGSGLARAGVDFALACGAFEQNITLLFTGAGVLQLNDQQSGNSLGLKDIGKQLASLPLYDIESVCVDADAGARYAVDLSSSPVPTRVLDATAVKALIAEHEHIISL